MNEMIELVRKNEQYKAQAHLNRVARELVVDYIDLMSVKDEEMTVELGEALRVQMLGMFRTLKKMGIDVESRM